MPSLKDLKAIQKSKLGIWKAADLRLIMKVWPMIIEEIEAGRAHLRLQDAKGEGTPGYDSNEHFRAWQKHHAAIQTVERA